jgi:nucleoside-diphosphate-sugar epimerase
LNKKITILGCGYLGTAIAKKCLSVGWEVTALTRNMDTAKKLEAMGVKKVVICKIADSSWHEQVPPVQDYVVNCVGAANRSLDGYRDSYLAGQKSAIEWMKNGSVQAYLFTSSTSVYPQANGEWVDENSSNVGCSERATILLDAERVSFPAKNISTRSYILRLAGIYGPGRHVLINKMKSGENYDGNSSRILNLIHRDDAVDAILSCLRSDNKSTGGVYNVTDDTASTRGEITDWLSKKLNLDRPKYLENDSIGTANRKVSNRKIVNEIDWNPNFPSYREGYESILNHS